MKHLCKFSCSGLLLVACGGTTYVDVNKLPDTYQCEHMKEVCKEAQEFQTKYSQMSKEEKEEFKTLLDTYKNQCNNALEQCKQSNNK